jgi:hypothetical protein
VIFAVARARPMVRTTNPMRRFSAAKTCSTLLRTRARVALPRAMCGGIGSPRGLARWNWGNETALLNQRQVGAAAIRRIGPDLARGVGGIEHGGELAAVVTRGVRE